MSVEAGQEGSEPGGNVVPIRSRDAEIIDFSEASVEIVTEMFLSQLRHPSRSKLDGEQLAEFIDQELFPEPDSETFTLESRLSRFVEDDQIIEVFEEKAEHDEVFRKIIEMQQKSTERGKEFSVQRHASMGLLKLRSIDHRHQTEDDPAWLNVINRLFERL